MRFLILMFLLCLSGLAAAQEDGEKEKLEQEAGGEKLVYKVGVAGSPPFVVEQGGEVDGLSVATWRALAKELQLDFELVPVASIEELLRGVQEGTFDLGVGPISITSQRATFVSFTKPYFDSSLGILSKPQSPSGNTRIKLNYKEIAFGFGTLMLSLMIVGAIFWRLEYKANSDHFPSEPAAGIGNGMWMALVTMTTVGYGDRAPITPAGRVFTGMWMLITTVTLSSFTAWIATSLTISRLEDDSLTRASQLADRRVAVVPGTTSEVFASFYNARLVFADNYLDAIELLKSDKVEGVVYDHPILTYYLNNNPEDSLYLSESTFAMQDYGFALPRSDERLKRINVALLKLSESGTLREIKNQWLK